MLSPLMFFGLLGLGVPVLIHLINRRQMPPRYLATLRFLDQEDVANSFAPRPRDVLQLLLRLLLIALFVLLMARLIVPSETTAPRALVIVLDNSMSMKREAAPEVTMFEHCQQQIAEMIDGMSEQDMFSFVLVGDRVFIDTGLTRDRQLLKDALSKAWVSDGGSRHLLPCVERGLAELQGQKVIDAAVLVFSDHQSVVYASGDRSPALRELLERGKVSLVLVGDSLPPVDNLSVERAAFHPENVFLGTSSKLTAAVRNRTSQEKTVEVKLLDGSSEGESRAVVLAAGEEVYVDLVHSFDSPVDVACSVEISSDGLDADNVNNLPMRMRKRRQILMIAPPKYQTADEMETSYEGVNLLAYAINPEEVLGLASGVHTSVKRVTPNGLERLSLSLYTTIVLYGVDQLPGEKSLSDLDSYVRGGGGLYIIPDADNSPVKFNETFSPLLGGLEIGVVKEPESALFLSKNEAAVSSPVLLPLMREEWGSPDDITVSRYFGIRSKGTASCVLRAANDDWLGAEMPLDKGRVFLQLFSCDIRDTGMPRSQAFVPMVRAVLDYVAGARDSLRPDIMRAGDTWYTDFLQFRGLGGDISVDGPGKHMFPMTPDGTGVKIHDIFIAGNYSVTHPAKRTGRRRWLAVNPVKGESELNEISEEELSTKLGAGNVSRMAYEEVVNRFSKTREILPWMLMVVFVALIVESVAGAWQSRKRETAT